MQFPIAMTPRTEPARAFTWLSPVLALALTVFTGFCLFAALGQNPLEALGVFFIAPLETMRGWTEIAVKMTPLLLCAAGLVVCFKTNIWNIGAEGQLIAGAIAGGAYPVPETIRRETLCRLPCDLRKVITHFETTFCGT